MAMIKTSPHANNIMRQLFFFNKGQYFITSKTVSSKFLINLLFYLFFILCIPCKGHSVGSILIPQNYSIHPLYPETVMPSVPRLEQGGKEELHLIKKYYLHSEMQKRCMWNIICEHRFLGDEIVLDVGCRDGYLPSLISKLIPYGKITAIDNSSSMIQFARRKFPKRDYPNLFFDKGANIDQLQQNTYDIIYSFFYLHRIQNISDQLHKMFHLLKEGGTLFICLPCWPNAEFGSALLKTMLSQKWEPYFKVYYPAPFRSLTSQEWETSLKESGFDNVFTERLSNFYPFIDKEEFIDWLESILPHVILIPESIRRNFVEEFANRYLELRPDSLGWDSLLYFSFETLKIKANKKKKT